MGGTTNVTGNPGGPKKRCPELKGMENKKVEGIPYFLLVIISVSWVMTSTGHRLEQQTWLIKIVKASRS